MKILFASDIHGSLSAAQRVIDVFESNQCDMLCLGGDLLNYGPRNGLPKDIDAIGVANKLNTYANKIVAVRGNCDSEVDQMLLRFPMLSDYAIVTDGPTRFFITHGHRFSAEPWIETEVIVTGHTHIWNLAEEKGIILCNTGSVTFPKEGKLPTMALYENNEMRIIDINGHELSHINIRK